MQSASIEGALAQISPNYVQYAAQLREEGFDTAATLQDLEATLKDLLMTVHVWRQTGPCTRTPDLVRTGGNNVNL